MQRQLIMMTLHTGKLHAIFFGLYGGYQFLYVEAEVAIDTNFVIANLNTNLNWLDIADATIEAICDFAAPDAIDTLSSVAGTMSNLFGFASNPPFSIRYSSAAESSIKSRVDGVLYTRVIYIQDQLDKVSGFAYYSWGLVEEFDYVLEIFTRYPISRRTSTTYNYREDTELVPGVFTTPGYHSGTTILRNILTYYNYLGYVTYDENLDVHSIFSSVIL